MLRILFLLALTFACKPSSKSKISSLKKSPDAAPSYSIEYRIKPLIPADASSLLGEAKAFAAAFTDTTFEEADLISDAASFKELKRRNVSILNFPSLGEGVKYRVRQVLNEKGGFKNNLRTAIKAIDRAKFPSDSFFKDLQIDLNSEVKGSKMEVDLDFLIEAGEPRVEKLYSYSKKFEKNREPMAPQLRLTDGTLESLSQIPINNVCEYNYEFEPAEGSPFTDVEITLWFDDNSPCNPTLRPLALNALASTGALVRVFELSARRHFDSESELLEALPEEETSSAAFFQSLPDSLKGPTRAMTSKSAGSH